MTRTFPAILASSLLLFAWAGPCALADSVAAWGRADNTQIGDGLTTNRLSPFVISSLGSNATAVSAGAGFSQALSGGVVYGWGNNSYGQIGIGTTASPKPAPLAASILTNVTSMSGGSIHSLAVQGGAVYAWGSNGSGQVGDGSYTTRTSPVPVPTLSSGVSFVAAGEYHSFAVTTGGALYAWGLNAHGELGDGTTTSRTTPVAIAALSSGVTQMAAGSGFSGAGAANAMHNLALKNGAVFAWGYDAYGQLGDGLTTPQLAPIAITSLAANVTAIAVGERHSLAVQNGLVYAWGYNGYGQLGDGTTNQSNRPQLVPGLSNILQVTATWNTSYALAADGSVWSWGDNQYGQLGIGDTLTHSGLSHLSAPTGYVFTSIDANPGGLFVLATLAPIPEPASIVLLTVGAVALVLRRRRALP